MHKSHLRKGSQMADPANHGSDHKDIDTVTGVETTGHEWDGIKELNNPAPRWWLIVWLVCIVWALGYYVFFPSWPIPGGNTKGILGWTEHGELANAQKEIAARQEVYLQRLHNADFKQIMADPELYAFAVAGGQAAFKDNCATCHGTGAAGGPGFPNLNDDDWLWGGKIADIYQTIRFGIRSTHADTRVSQMPHFGADGILTPVQVNKVVDYVLTLSGAAQPTATYEEGKQIFAENCTACHGPQGKGGREFGAPNLTDGIWLYGGTRADVYKTVFYAHAGVMPTWEGRLSPDTIRELAVYVHSLGGGEPDEQ